MGDAIGSIDDGVNVDETTKRKAALIVAENARGPAELYGLLDMLGLPPCERPLRTVEKWKKAKR